MKKIVLTTLVALLLASSSFAGIVITIKLDIGNKKKNCTGFGLCSIEVSATYQDGFVNGTLAADNVAGNMSLGISEKDILKIQPDKIVYFKGKGSVVFAEDYVLPSEFNKAMNVANPIVIKKGEHPLTYKNGFYYIEL
ncbi:MAG: hypothetical protein ACOYMD_15335 [Paludibacter sp.]|jgi:hypothetical protein